ncbi:MAG: hypothetical protein L6Q70_03900, partial [Thauera sp.]|nr:hypothetical protein [Thauera sp.]
MHELRLFGPEPVAVFDGTAVELLVIGHCFLSPFNDRAAALDVTPAPRRRDSVATPADTLC